MEHLILSIFANRFFHCCCSLPRFPSAFSVCEKLVNCITAGGSLTGPCFIQAPQHTHVFTFLSYLHVKSFKLQIQETHLHLDYADCTLRNDRINGRRSFVWFLHFCKWFVVGDFSGHTATHGCSFVCQLLCNVCSVAALQRIRGNSGRGVTNNEWVNRES